MTDPNGWCYLHHGRPGSAGEHCICGRFPDLSGKTLTTAPNLWPVILWLEGGCDPKWAAKELRSYAVALGQAEPAPAGVPQDGGKR